MESYGINMEGILGYFGKSYLARSHTSDSERLTTIGSLLWRIQPVQVMSAFTMFDEYFLKARKCPACDREWLVQKSWGHTTPTDAIHEGIEFATIDWTQCPAKKSEIQNFGDAKWWQKPQGSMFSKYV
jgi:hypothetical protein